MAFDQPYVPDAANILAQHGRGYALGSEMRQQNALGAAGQQLAQGNRKGAVNELYKGGEVEAGLKMEDQFRQDARQANADKLAEGARFNEKLANLAMLADTPEKWTAAIGVAKQAGLDVDKWADFGTRDYVIAQAGKATEVLTLELNRRKEQQALEAQTYERGRNERQDTRQDRVDASTEARQNRSLDLQEKALTIKETPPQYEFTKTGVGNKYTGDFKPYAKGQGTDPELTLEQGKYEQGLRKEYTALTGDLRTINDSLGRMQTSSKINTGAGDIAMVYSYMKMLDPTSVVREGEYATAENTGGIPERISNVYNKILTGQRLTPEQRSQFLESGEALAKDKVKRFQTLRSQFEGIAKSSGADPARIMLDEGMAQGGGGANEVPSDAVQMLRSDPTPQRIQQFEEVFGPGSAQRALGR
jgi:hypothetical protein